MVKFENPVIKQLLDEYKPLYGLDHALSIMGWDMDLPSELLEREAMAKTKALTAWESARKKSDFKMFSPHLDSIISGIALDRARKEIDDFDRLISSGDLQPIKDWLKAKIHRFGSTYSPSELLKRSFNEDYNPKYLIEYFGRKYTGNG